MSSAKLQELQEVCLVRGSEIKRGRKNLISWSVKDWSRSIRQKPQYGRYKLPTGELSVIKK